MSMMTNNADIQKIGIVYVFIMGFIQIPQKWDVFFIWLCIALDQIARFIINICIMKRKKVLQTAVR